jgi:hypothetical protein
MLFTLLAASAAAATLSADQTRALDAYLGAIQAKHYGAAFALLTKGQQAYFKNERNFASIFIADRWDLHSFKVVQVPESRDGSAVARVMENVTVLDPAHQVPVRVSLPVLYGILSEGGSYRINDRFHPWKSYAPANASATKDHFTVTVRKVSYYKDRLELVVTFANTGEGLVTVFPYGRSGLHDEQQRPYALVDSSAAARIDNELFLGLRLPIGAQYTGVLAFLLPPEAGAASRLDLSVGPVLREGEDEPFSVALPTISLPG